MTGESDNRQHEAGRDEVMRITSLRNPRVKYAAKLRDRRPRERTGEFLVEGYRCIRRALDAGFPLRQLFSCPELFQGENEESLIAACRGAGVEVMQVPAHVFHKLAYRDRPEGLLALAPQRRRRLGEVKLRDPSFVLVAESIEKPGNLGTMLRSADAAGVDLMVLCDSVTDLFNPNVVRASTGALFSVPFAEAAADEALDWLRGRNMRLFAATPHAENLYTEVDMTVPMAVLVGSEQFGLSDTWLSRADVHVRIPMMGMADSLNVSTATSLLLYEVLRQRMAGGLIEV